MEAEYVEVQQPLKVDSTDESSLILPWEMRDVGGGLGYALHTQREALWSLLPVDSADEPLCLAILIRASGTTNAICVPTKRINVILLGKC